MERRAFLQAAVGAATMPSVALAAVNTLKSFQLTDTHARPFADRGDVIDYETSDRELVHGRTYVTLTDTRKNLYVCRARFAQGFWWAEIFEQDVWYGPMTESFFADRVQGRVTAVYKTVN